MKRLFHTLTLLFGAALTAFPLSITVTPGELADKIANLGSDVTELSLSGSLSAHDLDLLRDLPASVKTLNLQDVDIVAFTGNIDSYPGVTMFNANELPANLFMGSKLESLRLPKSAVKVGEGVCAGSSLREVIVPQGVEEIGDYAFYNCPELSDVRLSASLSKIGRMAFAKCSKLSSLDLSSTQVTTLPDGCMADCRSLLSLKLPSQLTELGSEVFAGTAVRRLEFKNLKKISAYALAGMPALESVAIYGSPEIERGTVADNPMLEEVTLSLTSIPELFAANSPSVNASSLLSHAEHVGHYALASSAVDSLILGSELRTIGKGALANASSLVYIDARDLGTNMPDVETNAFANLDCPSIVLHVQRGTADLWGAHPVWSNFMIDADSTSISGLPGKESDFSIRLVNGLLTIDAPAPISICKVWTLDGQTLLSAASETGHLECELRNTPTGAPIILTLKTQDGATHSVKLLAK